jgi:hypothetical protein
MVQLTVVIHYVVTGETKPEKQFKHLEEYKKKFEKLNDNLEGVVNVYVPTHEKEGMDIQTINKE